MQEMNTGPIPLTRNHDIMEGIPMLGQSPATVTAGSIGVALCVSDVSIRHLLRSLIEKDSLLTVAADTDDWRTCRTAIQDRGCELLIVSSELLSSDWSDIDQHDSFAPLIVELRHISSNIVLTPRYADVTLPVRSDAIRRMLDHAVSRIYARKASQLLYLVDRYIAESGSATPQSSSLTVEAEGQPLRLNVDTIVSIVAARRHVHIHSTRGRFLLRSPLNLVLKQLDPQVFVQIHRSIVVNRYRLDRTVPITPRSTCLVSADGMRHRIGANYRHVVAQLLRSQAAPVSASYIQAS